MRLLTGLVVGVAAMAMASTVSAASAASGSHRFLFVNKTNSAIVRLTFRSLDGKGGKVEVLNGHSVGKGRSRVVSVPNDGTCKYGVLGEMEQDSGYYDLMTKADLCKFGQFVLSAN
ncbi:hypothetical protein GOZ89_10165 [Agrobacterium vitis]|uniref:hypothetical protein n=1 Tax=Agrobacterium vitis TaxID=373 RepID=UPI0012E91101|nr:hypothetical protein [Agrobacterium vitis]MCF1454858.1 hypothetical protein [Agrobacterium vitis]MCF1468607.1 hypothetical protein [Agrobacterium vitis]MVA79780.1 hypothetical protein [Agrobacterium vitis]